MNLHQVAGPGGDGKTGLLLWTHQEEAQENSRTLLLWHSCPLCCHTCTITCTNTFSNTIRLEFVTTGRKHPDFRPLWAFQGVIGGDWDSDDDEGQDGLRAASCELQRKAR